MKVQVTRMRYPQNPSSRARSKCSDTRMAYIVLRMCKENRSTVTNTHVLWKWCACVNGGAGPRPSRDSFTKEGLVSNVGILGCAESACSENGNSLNL